MSKEKMIETIKQIIEFTEDICIYETENKTMKEVLNLIDKLQKENKELKDKNKKLKRENEALEILHEVYKEVIDNGDFISKDIIRNKIKEHGKQHYKEKDLDKRFNIEAQIEVLEELIEGDKNE